MRSAVLTRERWEPWLGSWLPVRRCGEHRFQFRVAKGSLARMFGVSVKLMLAWPCCEGCVRNVSPLTVSHTFE